MDGRRGLLGFPVARHTALMLATVSALVYGISAMEIGRLVGVWAFALGFSRELFTCLGVVYDYLLSMPPKRRVRITGAVANELGALVALAPSVHGRFRAQPLESSLGGLSIYCTDAAGDGGLGACETSADESTWGRLHTLCEGRGCYTSLDWRVANLSPPPTRLAQPRELPGLFRL